MKTTRLIATCSLYALAGLCVLAGCPWFAWAGLMAATLVAFDLI